MSELAPNFVCHGCGAVVDIGRHLPFACPNAGRRKDDIDHVLVPELMFDKTTAANDFDPFIRYRSLISSYQLSRFLGLPDDFWSNIVSKLEHRLLEVDGRSFRITPLSQQPNLGAALVSKPRIWVKDETENVAGSHKGRHLMGVMLYLRVLEAAPYPDAQSLRKRHLAIASCGNAALAGAVIARAAEWPIEAFIPMDANFVVVKRLKELGATINVCERRHGETGDPCMRAFREAVRNGAIPFSVQGSENGLAVEGTRTLALEMAEGFRDTAETPDNFYIQVGGGALVSALAQGLEIARRIGLISKMPKLMLVQTNSCAPIARAWKLLSNVDLRDAVRHRSNFMWPWRDTKPSAASGILDDETYDWWEAVKGVRNSGGEIVVVDEKTILQAFELARSHTTIRASATGTAGLAGLLASGAGGESAAVIFTGSDQNAT
jgi:threonine synthase